MGYTAAVLHLHDGRIVDIDVRYQVGAHCDSVWAARLRALRRACKRLNINLTWGDWCYMGGNAWTAGDILNA